VNLGFGWGLISVGNELVASPSQNVWAGVGLAPSTACSVVRNLTRRTVRIQGSPLCVTSKLTKLDPVLTAACRGDSSPKELLQPSDKSAPKPNRTRSNAPTNQIKPTVLARSVWVSGTSGLPSCRVLLQLWRCFKSGAASTLAQTTRQAQPAASSG
jgi:hypothetical protein